MDEAWKTPIKARCKRNCKGGQCTTYLMIVDVHLGRVNSTIQVASIRAAGGIIKCPICKICILSMREDDIYVEK